MSDVSDIPVKATRTSIEVLEALIEQDGATLTELVEQMDLSKSSIHNHLTTLTRLGFVVREGWTYRVSLRFLQIGTRARNRFELYQVGVSNVAQLSSASGLEAGMFVLEGDKVVCLSTTTQKGVLEPIVGDGDVVPIHCTAPGKAMLAALPDDRVDVLLDGPLSQYTANTITTPRSLRERFDVISSQGWAVDREEWKDGVRGIATAITGPNGKTLGTVGVTGTVGSLSGKRFQQDIPGLVISTRNSIKKELKDS
jgi:DNA-binding IclR family transcriptional regulator